MKTLQVTLQLYFLSVIIVTILKGAITNVNFVVEQSLVSTDSFHSIFSLGFSARSAVTCTTLCMRDDIAYLYAVYSNERKKCACQHFCGMHDVEIGSISLQIITLRDGK